MTSEPVMLFPRREEGRR